jgi:hypothetical protein
VEYVASIFREKNKTSKKSTKNRQKANFHKHLCENVNFHTINYAIHYAKKVENKVLRHKHANGKNEKRKINSTRRNLRPTTNLQLETA